MMQEVIQKEPNKRILKYIYSPRYYKWVLMGIIVLLGFLYNYQNILFYRPQSVHQWRQCDCLTLTMNFCRDGNHFLEPSFNNLGADGNGKNVSEFPIVYYLMGKAWKLFGHHEFIYRLFNLLLFIVALFLMFRTIEHLLRDSFIALFIVILFFTSPALVYYANNFLVNITSLSLAIIGLHFFYRFYKSQKNLYFILYALFFLIAGLLKITSMVSYVAISAIFLIELSGFRIRRNEKIFKQPIRHAIILLIVYFILFIWYSYAKRYNAENSGEFFLIGILPVWDLSTQEIYITFDNILTHFKTDYFLKWTQFVLMGMYLFILIFNKKLPRSLLFFLILISVGFLIYLILFFQALRDHDYYVINVFMIVPVVLTGFFLVLRNRVSGLYFSWVFRTLLLGFLIYNISFASRKIHYRYKTTGWMNNRYYSGTMQYIHTGDYLRSMGLTRKDTIINLEDNSINISLYLMDFEGWSNYGIDLDSSKIADRIKLGAKYLLIDDALSTHPHVKPFLSNEFGQCENLLIYKLRN